MSNKPDDSLAELVQETSTVQALVADGLAKQCRTTSHEIVQRDDWVIEQVKQFKEEQLVKAMGELMARTLKFFCERVDFDHPTIQDVVRHGFQRDSEFNSTLREILTLLRLEDGTSMPKVLALLKDSLTKHKSMKEIRISIYKPPVRALMNQVDRTEARSKKASKEVCLKEWLEKAKNWNDHPSSFATFTRMNDSHNSLIEQNLKKAKKFEEHMMTSLAASMRRRNDIIQSFLSDTYFGFFKLRMLDAAIILAKVHGAAFREDYRSISYSRSAFESSGFWLEADKAYEAREHWPGCDPEKPRKVTVGNCIHPDMFTFKPRAYPLHEFEAGLKRFGVGLPGHVIEVIESVERHPDVLSKALFDQFWVMVPGITLAQEMHLYSNYWVIRNGDRCELHQSQESAEKSLDYQLVKNGCLHPALLGEKDGKCYFLTYLSFDHPKP